MKTLIDTYQSFPGEHCGSVAMRGLLHHYCGLDLPEPAVFGLGSGTASVYITGPGLNPSTMIFGRTLNMEQDLAANLELDYRERQESDDGEAWQIAREEVLAGRPTMLSGDIFYLDYRDYKVHFPGHRFVLVGFDDATGKAFIADRIRPEPEACSYAALISSRNPPEGMSTHNLWGRFHDTTVGRELKEATRLAIAHCARAMLADSTSDGALPDGPKPTDNPGVNMKTGLVAVRTFAADLPNWPARENAGWTAGYTASCIEKFGNGGGNFRRLYSGFLSWARELDPKLAPESAPGLAVEAADGWTAVSNALFAASRDEGNPQHWHEAAGHAARIVKIEERLFQSLADAVA